LTRPLAIVGRVGLHQGQGLGPEIDRHGSVLRFHGWSPRPQDAADYGLRCTTICHSGKFGWGNSPVDELVSVLIPLPQHDYGDRIGSVPRPMRNRTRFLSGASWIGLRQSLRGAWPSTGIAAIWDSVSRYGAESIDLYAMDFWLSGKGYYMPSPDDAQEDPTNGPVGRGERHNGAHDAAAERKLAEELLSGRVPWLACK
jgi:hypothetical protein